MSQPPLMLSIKETAAKSGLSVATVRALIKAGKVVHINTGRKYLINWERFIEYLDRGETVAPPLPSVAGIEQQGVRPKRKTTPKPPTNTRFVPPTVEEVAAYCKERGNGIDPEAFVDFYTSKGWKIGSNQMKDWKATVRTWEKRQRAEHKTTAQPPDEELLRIFNGE